MRATTGVVAVLIGCLSAAAADEKYTSKDGKFAVAFPKAAKVAATAQDAGGMKMHTFTAKDGDKSYMVMYMDLPEAAKDAPAKAILDGMEKGSVQKSGGKLVSSKDLAFGKDKLPGRDVLIEKNGATVHTRFVL